MGQASLDIRSKRDIKTFLDDGLGAESHICTTRFAPIICRSENLFDLMLKKEVGESGRKCS